MSDKAERLIDWAREYGLYVQARKFAGHTHYNFYDDPNCVFEDAPIYTAIGVGDLEIYIRGWIASCEAKNIKE